jgi:hypothetical protein
MRDITIPAYETEYERVLNLNAMQACTFVELRAKMNLGSLEFAIE